MDIFKKMKRKEFLQNATYKRKKTTIGSKSLRTRDADLILTESKEEWSIEEQLVLL